MVMVGLGRTDVRLPARLRPLGGFANGHLRPAEIFVRRDIREVLGCPSCGAELVRAPMGDKVVAAGAYGPAFVPKLVIAK